jgi:hypothetical protein
MIMNRRLVIVGAALGVLLLTATVAVAALSSYGPVRVESATSFASTGDLIAGWYWLRDPSKTATATWTFTGLPVSSGIAKNNKVYVRLEPLVTNRANGGAGYSTMVQLSYVSRAGHTYRRTVNMVNLHPEMKDSRDSSGWGYQAFGVFDIPVSRIPLDGSLVITMKRVSATKYHIAGSEGACTVEYLAK